MNASSRSAPSCVGGDEGVDVAEHFLALAHVLAEQGQQVVVRHARRDTASSAGSGCPLRRSRARAGESLVPPMSPTWPTVPVSATSAPVAEHRRDHGDVEQVAGAQPGIVGDQHVAGLQRLGREFAQQRLHRARQRQVEHRHGARRVRQALAARRPAGRRRNPAPPTRSGRRRCGRWCATSPRRP